MDNGHDMLQLCRLCLVKDDVNIPIFQEHDDNSEIFVKISSCLPVKLERNDKLPQNICDSCFSKLDVVYDLWTTSSNSDKQLHKWLYEAEAANAKEKRLTKASNKSGDAIVKQEKIDDAHETVTYVEEVPWDGASSSAGPSASLTAEDEPPPKRARRAAAVKASITVAAESDDDDDDDNGPMTKMEDDSDENDPTFGDVPSTSADDQPGPSGVGKDGSEAPWDIRIVKEDPEIHARYKCAICGFLFDTKEKFMQHNMHILDLFICCRCQDHFKTSDELYQHYEVHKEEIGLENVELGEVTEEIVDDEVEEMVLNYDNEEVIVQQGSVNDTNELLYILDDSQCVNEVVIQEEEPIVEKKQDNVAIVNFEHGYMIPSDVLGETVLEEVIEDDDFQNNINLIVNKRLSLPIQPSTSKKVLSQPKPRTPQPKRRHEVPDFSATNYVCIGANDEIDVPHYKCLRCEQLFINKIVFFRHIEKGKCYINNCDVCRDTFTKNSDFYLHYVTQHTDRAICNFCFRTFMYEKNVKEHMLRHLDQFRHRCEECSKGFYTVREYRNHYKNRHMGIRHKCEVCGRSFADEYYFKRHIATHSKANPPTFLHINQLTE